MQYAAIDSVSPDRDVLRCLPESLEEKQELLDYQGAFGMGAYDNDAFVGSLWFYRIEDRGFGSPVAPPWSGWRRENEDPRLALSELNVQPPFLGLSCFHVGRTKALESKDRNDETYYGKGIGSGLLATAVEWAAQRDYMAIVTTTGIDAFPEFNNWAGMLPLKVYLRQGFDILHAVDATESIPGHLRKLAPACQLTQAVVGKRTHECQPGSEFLDVPE
jgi:GNAT superfamily N-acetyltransferase